MIKVLDSPKVYLIDTPGVMISHIPDYQSGPHRYVDPPDLFAGESFCYSVLMECTMIDDSRCDIRSPFRRGGHCRLPAVPIEPKTGLQVYWISVLAKVVFRSTYNMPPLITKTPLLLAAY